jgi:hypothetical protein
MQDGEQLRLQLVPTPAIRRAGKRRTRSAAEAERIRWGGLYWLTEAGMRATDRRRVDAGRAAGERRRSQVC